MTALWVGITYDRSGRPNKKQSPDLGPRHTGTGYYELRASQKLLFVRAGAQRQRLSSSSRSGMEGAHYFLNIGQDQVYLSSENMATSMLIFSSTTRIRCLLLFFLVARVAIVVQSFTTLHPINLRRLTPPSSASFSKKPNLHLHRNGAPRRATTRSITSDTGINDTATNIGDAGDNQEVFVWSKQWYPILPLSYLQGKDIENKPYPFQLLGRNLVAWKTDGDGTDDTGSTWSVMIDECPHRKAPLSTGKVVGGCNLMCRFHGWQFSSDGTCTDIPMFPREGGDDDNDTKLNSLLKTDAFRVRSFPTKSAGGLLWVYLGDDLDESGAAPSMVPEDALLPEEVAQKSDWIVTSFPVSYMSMVENSFDPSHAPFIHEGIMSYSPERATPMKMFKHLENTTMSASGFTLQHTPYEKKDDPNMTVRRQFLPPTVQKTKFPYFGMDLYFVPSGLRETLVLSNVPLTKMKFDRFIPGSLRCIIYDAAHFIGATGEFNRRFTMVSVSRKGRWRA